MGPVQSAVFGILVACNSSGSSGNASVTGNVNGKPVVVREVVGVVGTQTENGVATSYAVVLISDTDGTCSTAQQSGVSAAASRANVLEIAATKQGTPFAVGTYTVGTIGLAEYFYLNNGGTNGVSGGGTITFDAVNEKTVSGKFDVNLAGGQHVTGTFSAPICGGVPAQPFAW